MDLEISMLTLKVSGADRWPAFYNSPLVQPTTKVTELRPTNNKQEKTREKTYSWKRKNKKTRGIGR
jgi:hypothetical protein